MKDARRDAILDVIAALEKSRVECKQLYNDTCECLDKYDSELADYGKQILRSNMDFYFQREKSLVEAIDIAFKVLEK